MTYIYLMGEHRPGEKESNIRMHVVLLKHIMNRWQSFHVLVHGIRRAQEGSELDQCVLALIVQLPN